MGPITLVEHAWRQLHNDLLTHTQLHFTYYRYVDDRVTYMENSRPRLWLHVFTPLDTTPFHTFSGRRSCDRTDCSLCPNRTLTQRLPALCAEKAGADSQRGAGRRPTVSFTLCSKSFLRIISRAGGERMTSQRWPTKLVVSWEAVRRLPRACFFELFSKLFTLLFTKGLTRFVETLNHFFSVLQVKVYCRASAWVSR